MATLRVGTLTPTGLKLGAVNVAAAYLGTIQVWPLGNILVGVGKRPVAALAGSFTAAPAVTATLTASANRPTSAISAVFAPPGVVGGAIAASSKKATATINATYTPGPVTATITASSNRPAALITATMTGSTTVAFRSISAVAAADGGGTVTVAKPAGVATGDLLLIFCHSHTNNTMACTGFAVAGVGTYASGGETRRSHFLWKIATGSEGSTFSVTGGGGIYNEAICFAYTGVLAIGATGVTDNNFNSPALTVASNGSMEVAALEFDNSSVSAAGPAGWTRRLNGDGSFGAWAAERAANAGTTTSSNFTGVGDTTFGFGMNNIILSPTAVAPTVPAAPVLSAGPGDTQVVLTWTAPNDGNSPITGYLVETSATGTSGWSTVTTTAAVLTYTHTGRTNGTTYYYRVSAINGVGTGPVSNVASATPAVNTWADNFNRADSTLGAPDYALWLQYGTTPGVVVASNAAKPSPVFQSCLAVRISTAVASNRQRIKVTCNDPAQRWALSLFQTATPLEFDGITAQWISDGQVYWWKNGVYDGGSTGSRPTGTHTYELRYNGTAAEFLIDGVVYATHAMAVTFAGGRLYQGFGFENVPATTWMDDAEGGVW